jgi:Type II secretion system (T2SS), protein E, N-terminal domain
VADDAGALLVRSGLVATNALDDARARVASAGGTLGEQLVIHGAITDDALTDFYRSRLLVPQVNPNMLARLTPKVVAMLPGDLAIELRAVPVALDPENNLTVAMSDPSDRHAVDEIAFFTGAYVVRAVATQMQIAWCLAHYYGHVTALGQRLLHTSGAPRESPIKSAISAAVQRPRTKGLTGKVNATRHRAIAPITGPVNVLRPNSGELDLRPVASPAPSPAPEAVPRAPVAAPAASAPAAPAANASAAPAANASAAPAANASAAPAANASTAPAANASAAPAANASAAPAANASAAPAAPLASSLRAPAAPGSARSGLPSGTPPNTPVAIPSGPRPGVLPDPPALTQSSPRVVLPPAPAALPPASAAAAASPLGPRVGVRPDPPAPSSPRAAPPNASAAPPTITRPGVAVGVLPEPSIAAAAQSAALAVAGLVAGLPRAGLVPRAAPDAPTLPPINAGPAASPGVGELEPSDGAPDRGRTRSVSGEIRVPARRAPSIRPPLPPPDDDDDEPQIVIERDAEDDATGPRPLPPPPRRRAVKSDPPELYARAGEVDLKPTGDRTIADEPRIVIDEDALSPPTARIDTRRTTHDDAAPLTAIDVADADTGAVIHDRIVERIEDDERSQPILLDRPRATPDPMAYGAVTIPHRDDPSDPSDDDDTGETDIVVLDARKPKHRAERRTQVGVPPAPVTVRPHRDTETSAVPTPVDRDLERTAEIDDPTTIDLQAAPPGDETMSDQLAAPPAPASEYDTNPHVIAPPPAPAPPRISTIQLAMIIDEDDDEDHDDDDHVDDDEDEDDEHDDADPRGPRTSEMTAVELDDAIPERTSEFDLSLLSRRRRHVDYDPVDDGWGPPGTTIPPPLLGAIPGSEDDDEGISTIPMPSIDSSPLMVGPVSLPSTGDTGGQSLVRALEDTTARAIEVIRRLEHAGSRDEVVEVMVAYLAETHHRAGFFVTRHGTAKGSTELGMFSMTPRPAVLPFATLRLDRPSTLQDVVDTRLPYRGPMHDDTSRGFLVSVLGACPAEILLVPVAVRERVVGVLFGEHRQRHTFDDQLALAARAAGMALERILRAKRG